MSLLIQELDSSYQGKQISFPYQSSHYYDLQRVEENGVLHFKLQKRPFEQPLHKQFETELLQQFLSRHRLFAALLEGQMQATWKLHWKTGITACVFATSW